MKRICTLCSILWLFAGNPLLAQRPVFYYQYETVRLDSTYNPTEKSEMSDCLEHLHKKISKKMSVVIGETKEEMRSFSPASLLSNFLTDKLFEYGDDYLFKKKGVHADLSLLNIGGIRASFPKGNITVGDVFQTIPFDNTVVIIALKGSELKKIFFKIKVQNVQPYSHAKMLFRQNYPFSVLVNGKPIEDDIVYYLVTVDFIKDKGDNIIPQDAVYQEVFYTKELFRDVLIQQIKQMTKEGKIIESGMDDRVVIEALY